MTATLFKVDESTQTAAERAFAVRTAIYTMRLLARGVRLGLEPEDIVTELAWIQSILEGAMA